MAGSDPVSVTQPRRTKAHCPKETKADSGTFSFLGVEGWDFTRNSTMAKRRSKYSRSAGNDVKSEMHRYKRGTAKSGPGGKGGKVKNRKQAIAIGLSKARKKGKRVPQNRAS